MGRQKSSAELEDDIRRLEERLNAVREKKRQLSKAEEAKQNAAVIKSVKEYWAALPEQERPRWEDMPGYLNGIFYHKEAADQGEQTDQEGLPWQSLS